MSWLFSQALVAEYSAGTCSDGELSAQLNVMPTPHKFWRNGKTMDVSQLSQFGLTCAVLTEDRGAELLTSYLGGFHAKTSAAQVEAPDSMASGPGFGQKWRGSWVTFDPVSCSWKTAQCSLLADWESFSEIWPRSGLMLRGECFPLPASVRPMSVNAYGSLLPTPTLVSCEHPGRQKVKPNQQDCISAALSRRDQWAPGGRWSPNHAAWLMGWPESWTNLSHSATGKYRRWLRLHSIVLQQT